MAEADYKLFAKLSLPCRHAAMCRNHFVHGSETKIYPLEHPAQFAFLTHTLEFIFAVSFLIDFGWDLNKWLGENRESDHPFALYVRHYRENMKGLERAL